MRKYEYNSQKTKNYYKYFTRAETGLAITTIGDKVLKSFPIVGQFGRNY